MANESIFEFADKFGYESPFGKWVEDKVGSTEQSSKVVKQNVQYYVHPDKNQFQLQKEKAVNQYSQTKSKYIEYYKKIGKLKDKFTEQDLNKVISEDNKKELKRLDDFIKSNQKFFENASKIEIQWNKLNSTISDVVFDFNNRKGYNSNNCLNPNLIKSLMFSESELGAGLDYIELIEYIPKKQPNAVYQLNLGRVTDGNVYNSVVNEFKIPVNWKTNYKDMGNKNDVMLATGALIQKKEYSTKIKSDYFKSNLPWFNAVVAYKGVSAEGFRKAVLVWNLFKKGVHPYNPKKKF